MRNWRKLRYVGVVGIMLSAFVANFLLFRYTSKLWDSFYCAYPLMGAIVIIGSIIAIVVTIYLLLFKGGGVI